MHPFPPSNRGQVAPLIALIALAVGVACLGLGRFASGAVDAARARTAADAAALAGARDDDEMVREIAARNGGVVTSIERVGGDVRVRVRVGAQTASARARTAPPSRPGGSGGTDRRLPKEGRG